MKYGTIYQSLKVKVLFKVSKAGMKRAKSLALGHVDFKLVVKKQDIETTFDPPHFLA